MGKYTDCLENTPYNVRGIHLSSVPMLLYIEKHVDYNKCAEAICSFTSFQPLEHLGFRFQGFHLKRKKPEIYRLQFEEENIEFSKFSDLIMTSNFKQKMKMKFQLLNEKKRKGSCHYWSMFFLEYFGDRIVNAYIDDPTEKFRVVHSFIELNNKVYDYTKNLVISKEDYYRLFNVEVINTIDRNVYLEDIKNPFFNSFIDCKFYCLFRDELLNGHTFTSTFWKVDDINKEKIKR